MNQLTIISGAGINLGVSAACPDADEIVNFTYQKISSSVYDRISPKIQAMFSPDSFDYILGGLLTINLAIEKTKTDLNRFNMDQSAFSELFQQSHLQDSIANALDAIEEKLRISLGQMLRVVEAFDPSIEKMASKYQSINYFTLNFDGIFDHIIYGNRYKRGGKVTDFWKKEGTLDNSNKSPIKIFHLHGDLRYKPFKKTQYNTPTYRWPVLVVGDQEVKKGIIASNEALRFYNNCFNSVTETRGDTKENTLAIIGFGFRDEDEHIVKKINSGISSGVFDKIYLYSPEDKLSGITKDYTWVKPSEKNLIQFLSEI